MEILEPTAEFHANRQKHSEVYKASLSFLLARSKNKTYVMKT